MKTTCLNWIFFPTLAVVSMLLLGCGTDNATATGPGSQGDSDGYEALMRAGPPVVRGDISDAEREDLLYMREEEKVARDVYIAMYSLYGSRVFYSISQSEERHMSAVLTLLNRYNIPDPVGDNGIGIFTNQKLQGLYTQLVQQGSASLSEAYRVGVLIEETDIADLKDAISRADNPDIVNVYQHLLEGSYNHLQAFNRHTAQ